MDHVVELVAFETEPGTGDDQLVSAAQAAGAFLARQPGFVRRHLARRADGGWIDLVEWTSLDAAQAAARLFPSSPESAAFMRMIAQGASMTHAAIRLSQ